MLSWVIQQGIISLIVIILIHSIYTFLQNNLTTPKIRDLVNKPNKQYEEIFIGKNNLRYRNIFYLASYSKNNIDEIFFKNTNTDQIKEIKDVQWFDYDKVCSKISNKIKKLELFKRIHAQIIKTKNLQ